MLLLLYVVMFGLLVYFAWFVLVGFGSMVILLLVLLVSCLGLVQMLFSLIVNSSVLVVH